MDIEQVAEETPEKIFTVAIAPDAGLQDYQARQLAFGLGLDKQQMRQFGDLVKKLYKLYLDTDEPVTKLEIGDNELILEVGEWSDWMPVEFELTGPGTLPGIVRFYLRQIEPEVELYASPVNFDPMNPAQPISSPDSFAAELAEATGLFYTQGMPEDTQALSGPGDPIG